MTHHTVAAPVHARGARLRVPMYPRSPHEAHRTATPLELLFDLVFVVAISQAAAALHHAVAENHAAAGLGGYLMVFFAIWLAWLNFTWFASSYDTDDVPYRLVVFVQIAGALVLAAGVPSMFEQRTPNVAVIGGYVVMRLAMVTQWLRAATSDPEHRVTARRYAEGIGVLQVAWVATLWMPAFWVPCFLVLAALELMVPLWAERASQLTWHPHHVAERYGLLTLIVLGESILSATTAVQSALASGDRLATLAPIIVGGLLIVYSLWWMYFDRPVHDLLTSFRKAIVWGYGHYVVFASAAAVGAGLAVNVDAASHHAEISSRAAGAAVAIPVALYTASLWLLHDRPEYRSTRVWGALITGLVLLTPFAPQPVLVTGVLLATLIGVKLVVRA